ncbi:perlucin-like protein [Pomacea canaliculata]|uniref:perlucin-like protein n=1 Tax=Pomacea canaliculata TaxID=400727 RepID=UPI000D731976|nr:perlucin-like protein [Pomacea canaliculata]
MSTSTLLLLLALTGVCHCFVCPNSWTRYGNSCYAYIGQPLPWVDARSFCRAFGGHLVEITSASENTFVRNLINSRGAGKVWLGINDLVQNGRWELTSNGRRIPYSNWARGEPNNWSNQACGAIYSNGQWDDDLCSVSRTFPFVCEKLYK